MASYLRPCISLASWGASNMGFFGPASFPVYLNPSFFADSRTPYVRVWIRWDCLQPNGAGTNPVTDTSPVPALPGYTVQTYLVYKALEILTAQQAGKKVILQFHAVPDWANPNTRASGPNPAGRANHTAPPDDVTHTSRFAQMVFFLAAYFNPINPYNPGAFVDYLEICNEPNLEFWPQINNAGQYVMPYYAAGMLSTARWVTQNYTSSVPSIMGPGIADSERTDTSVSGISEWSSFTASVLYLFPFYGTPSDDHMVWTQHNYGDVKNLTNHATTAVGLLDTFGWTGYPAGGAYVYLTEGGLVISGPSDYAAQAADLADAWVAMYGTLRVGMMTNYQTWSDPGYDSGLCGHFPPGGPPTGAAAGPYERPALATWAGLPTTYPR